MIQRWHATIYYRTESGIVDVEHVLEELGEIETLVERGPHWDTIENITIKRINHCTGADLTVERAAEL